MENTELIIGRTEAMNHLTPESILKILPSLLDRQEYLLAVHALYRALDLHCERELLARGVPRGWTVRPAALKEADRFWKDARDALGLRLKGLDGAVLLGVADSLILLEYFNLLSRDGITLPEMIEAVKIRNNSWLSHGSAETGEADLHLMWYRLMPAFNFLVQE